MNFLNVFEERVGSLFGAGVHGAAAPFSFKKLAKKAAREMENETFVVDGVDTAPGLFTILVSSEDDMAMRPIYAQLTAEAAQFIEGQAQNKGYVFVGRPLVRFMADPSLKSGRFSVFAENVDAQTLNRLREEEAKFLGIDDSVVNGFGGAAAQAVAAPERARARVPASAPQPVAAPAPAFPAEPGSLGGADDGFDVLPQEAVLDAEQQAFGVAARAGQGVPLVSSRIAQVPSPAAHVAPAASAAPAAHAAPQASAPKAPTPPAAAAVAPAAAAAPAAGAASQAAMPQTVRATPAKPAPEPRRATCLLIDRQSGRTYTGAAPRTTIGRERTPGGIVLRDPNVSREHAEVSYDGRTWHIRDLNSTNGTLVNDVDVDECPLRDGDLITLGLVNLEFRES